MRAVVQKVRNSKVTVDNEITGEIGQGLMVLLGVTHDDTEADARYMAEKIANLRIFEDDADKMNLSVKDVGGELLVVSQFTLCGDARKGKRPSFDKAAKPDLANAYYEKFVELCRAQGLHVETGVFRAHMLVGLVNNGPVTILLDSTKLF